MQNENYMINEKNSRYINKIDKEYCVDKIEDKDKNKENELITELKTNNY